MSNLIKKELTLDSREVARMVDKNHKELLRDIRTYEGYLGESNFALTDFFIPSTYISSQNKELPNYQITKKGCEFIAHKLTGQKGALFTATYINRFHEMEQRLVEGQPKAIDNTKAKEISTKLKNAEARLKNAKVREANVYLKIADKIDILEYQQIMYSKATEVLSGQPLLPLPRAEQKTYTATEIGEMLGISANKVGRLANKHNLKTSEFGKMFYDKAKHSNKQVEAFRYYENVVPIMKNLCE